MHVYVNGRLKYLHTPTSTYLLAQSHGLSGTRYAGQPIIRFAVRNTQAEFAIQIDIEWHCQSYFGFTVIPVELSMAIDASRAGVALFIPK